ncbi:unnamed protein product [Clavelina lepadiformis]|uniref:Acetyl-coenzyme A transporter 1 n=1 Tax=Clavelina lepadiformis TaxID=159417 RepID=A0ABP0FAR7_CLALP
MTSVHENSRSRKRVGEDSASNPLTSDSSINIGSNSELNNLDENSIKENPKLSMDWWYEDRSSVLLLLFLYILQGIPLGLAGSIPMMLAGRNVDYKEQALFSFVFWPFSLKLLWAPFVDGAFVAKFGRRKSWLVPTQYLIAVVMYILSLRLDAILEVDNPNVWHLTICFFILNFCAATQDIAVDGWALTMLSKKNVGLASTCNSVGQTAGYFLGFAMFLALESADFCNKYLRTIPQDTGIVTLASFMYFWSIIFFVTTTLVMILKHEGTDKEHDHADMKGVVATYKLLWKIILLPSVLQYVIILLTCKMAFGSESVVGLKLIECGVHKESLALLAIPLTPLQIALPLIIAKYTTGPRPMDVFLNALKFRLLFTVLFALTIHFTPSFKQEDGSYPYHYFAIILVVYCFHQVALYSMFVSIMAFNAKISDPRIGGSYMTLLNTVANLGGNWPSTLSLWFVDSLTRNYCVGGKSELEFCTKETKEQCLKDGGECHMEIDGYYVEAVICFFVGIVWLVWKSNSTRRLQALQPESWKCPT